MIATKKTVANPLQQNDAQSHGAPKSLDDKGLAQRREAGSTVSEDRQSSDIEARRDTDAAWRSVVTFFRYFCGLRLLVESRSASDGYVWWISTSTGQRQELANGRVARFSEGMLAAESAAIEVVIRTVDASPPADSGWTSSTSFYGSLRGFGLYVHSCNSGVHWWISQGTHFNLAMGDALSFPEGMTAAEAAVLKLEQASIGTESGAQAHAAEQRDLNRAGSGSTPECSKTSAGAP